MQQPANSASTVSPAHALRHCAFTWQQWTIITVLAAENK
jgi:hypothetical protein